MSENTGVEAAQLQPAIRLNKSWSAIFLIVGIASGFMIYAATEHIDNLAWSYSLSETALFAGILFLLSLRPGATAAAAGFSLALAVTIGLLAYTTIQRFGLAEAERSFLVGHLAGQSTLFAYILLPFFQTWLETRRRSFPYEQLFVYAWNNGLQVIVALGFNGLFWLILYLFATLFDAIGVSFLQDLIAEPAFSIPASTGATALGIFVARDHSRIVAALRAVVFALLSVLNPVFLLLAATFLVALVAGGFERFSSIISASATLLSLIAFGILLINAVLRDGSPEQQPNRLLQISTMVLLPVLLCFCGFAYYALKLRVADYGLTPERIWLAIATGILTIYSIIYVASLAFRGRWATVCRSANTFVALGVAAVALLTQTPLADPYLLSAKSQYSRLVDGNADPERFDFGYLKFDLGQPGLEALSRIQAASGEADRMVVEAKLAQLAEATNYWEWQQKQRGANDTNRLAILQDRERVRRVPQSLELSDEVEFARMESYDLPLQNCSVTKGHDCLITAIDLTDQPGKELVFASRFEGAGELYLLERRDGTWHSEFLRPFDEQHDIWPALSSGDVSAVPSDHRDLRIGRRVVRLRQRHSDAIQLLMPSGESDP